MTEIKVLVAPGCGSRDRTMAMVAEVAAQMAPSVQIVEVVVESPDQARELRFLGSPSVQVDGRDVEPAAQGRDDYGAG
ncbi:MAG: hypothetical protein DRI90_16040 [Deltaproteobacteria bacterium]|nr:MAG: hypothetical protein DRI90_16040 [Deltaproteobacteria bacterium]